MAEWGRDTPWRQGALLSVTDLQAAGLISGGTIENVVGVVVSHDCDISQGIDKEPDIEIIVATMGRPLDGNFSHGKNSRTLQVTAAIGDQSSTAALELLATGKRKIEKSKIVSAKPVGALQPVEKEILQRWLASRYRRSAFSDQFNDRLNDCGLKSKLEAVLKKLQKHISGIYFLIDDGEDITHIGEDDPFSLAVYVLYSTSADPVDAQKEAAEACAKIDADFKSKCRPAAAWKNFELVACQPISDETMTFAQANKMQRWNADHISYRTTPPGVIDEGNGIVSR
jgi:hypothetical protein